MKTVILPKEYKYDFKLPYNDQTKAFIQKMRLKGFKIRLRGSGARAKWSLKMTNGKCSFMYDSHIPLKFASYVRLYIKK